MQGVVDFLLLAILVSRVTDELIRRRRPGAEP